MATYLNPPTVLKESEKNEDWLESYLMYISQISFDNENRKNDLTCWTYYHNRINSLDTQYLTKIGKSELPAKVRRIPKQRPYLDRLSSQQQLRPFVFSVVLADKKSVEDKYLDQVQDYIKAIEDQAEFTHFETSFKIQQVQDQITKLQQMGQQQPQNTQEAQKIAEIKQILPQVINKFQYALSMLQKQDALTSDQIKNIQHYHKYEKKDWKEIVAQNTLFKLRSELDINTESTLSFINDMVVGRQAYYVDYIEGQRLPTFESLDPLTVTYPRVQSTRWIQDGPWVKLTNYTSYNDIVIKYGQQIKDKYGEEKLQSLQSAYSESTVNMQSGINGEAYFNGNMALYTGTDDTGYGIKVERIWIKVPRNIKVKYTPNPFEEGMYFRHFIQNKEIIDKKDWKFKDGFYINKKDPKDIRSEDEVEVVNSNKGEKFVNKYTNDLWHGVIINDEYIVDEGKVELVLRDTERHGKINLPVFGKTYASMVDQPYSLIVATRDLQDLYDIVHFHQELMLALSGTKTILFDLVFKPSTLTDEEWEEEKKKGTAYINTLGEDGKRTNFNQWQMFDLSVSSSIGVLDQIKNNLEDVMGDVMGIPRQMKGQMVETDQVGTYSASLKQAQLVTEIRFAEHDLIEAKALTHCLNLALKYCYKDGETFGITDSDLSGSIVNIPKDAFNNVRFSILVANNTEEKQGVEDMKQLILANYKAGQMKFEDVVDLWGIKTLTMLKEKAKSMSEKAQEIAQMNAANAQQAEVEKEKLKIQLNNELLAPWKDQEMQLKKMELDIKQQLGTLQAQVLADKNAILQKQVENEASIKTAKIQNERQTEDNAIVVNDKHLSNDEQIRMLEMQVNSLLEDAKIHRDDIVSRRKHHADLTRSIMQGNKQKAEGNVQNVQQ